MIDYHARLQDVYDVLAKHYHVTDTQVVDVLLASRLASPKLPYVWMVLETSWYTRDVDSTWPWFYFGLAPIGKSLATYRMMRTRELYALEDWSRQGPALFVEPDYDKPLRSVKYSRGHSHVTSEAWAALLQRTLTVRVEHQKVVPPPEARFELARAAEAVLDMRWREARPVVYLAMVHLGYWLEVLQKLAPALRSWEDLTSNVRALFSRLCLLRDIAAPDGETMSLIKRMLADCVPYPIAALVTDLATADRTKEQLTRAGHRTDDMGMLRKEGVLRVKHNAYWSLEMRDAAKLVAQETEL